MRKPIQILAGLFSLLPAFSLIAQVVVVNNGILTVKDSQVVHINGDFSNFSSQYSNQGDIGLTGNFLNDARVINPGIGIFRFIGSQEQTFTTFDTLDMFNVEIDNPAGLTLDGTTHLGVFGNMRFWDGIVYTNAETMLSFQDNASTSDGSFFSHINGPALKSGKNDFVFPLGKENDYRPAAISDLTNSSTFQMEYFHFPYFWYNHDFDIIKINQEGFWDLQRLSGSSNPKLTLTYDETTNMFPNVNDLEIVQWRNDLWEIKPSYLDDATPVVGLTTHEHLSDYGYFTTAQRRKIIPDVSIIDVSQNGCDLIIEWTMPTGTLISNYEIEYSYDSTEFTKVGEIAGDPNILTSYRTFQFVDQNLHESPVVFYRIKLIAPGPWAPFIYSPIVSIKNKCGIEKCVLYPNPVSSNENLNLEVSIKLAATMNLQVFDDLGRLLFKQTLNLRPGQRVYEIETREHRLASGTYFISINPKKSIKFIVINQ